MRKEKLEELKSLIEEFKTKRILEENDVSRGHFLKVKNMRVELNNGKILTREVLLKNNSTGSAVVMLPVTKENDVLLVVEPRIATKLTVGVGLPAGYIEKGEEPVEAAKRELNEETGFSSNNAIHLASFYQDSGCSKAYNHAFLLKDCIKTSEQHLDETEYIKYFTCKYDEALYLMENGYINDCNGIIALEKSKRYMKER